MILSIDPEAKNYRALFLIAGAALCVWPVFKGSRNEIQSGGPDMQYLEADRGPLWPHMAGRPSAFGRCLSGFLDMSFGYGHDPQGS